jgi:hypothetical protein
MAQPGGNFAPACWCIEISPRAIAEDAYITSAHQAANS